MIMRGREGGESVAHYPVVAGRERGHSSEAWRLPTT